MRKDFMLNLQKKLQTCLDGNCYKTDKKNLHPSSGKYNL